MGKSLNLPPLLYRCPNTFSHNEKKLQFYSFQSHFERNEYVQLQQQQGIAA